MRNPSRRKFSETCAIEECGKVLVTRAEWAILSPEARQGKAVHEAHGLCRGHNKKRTRWGTPTPGPFERPSRRGMPTGPQRRAEDVLEDWALLRSDGVSVEAAARRMNMTFAALEQVLYRARQRGDERGNYIYRKEGRAA